ncbi:hypothetical protein ACIBJE_09645 [Micromonospora sp. NPDC050187]|uniref:hypothetical protein n=1 Tax=Micromonospora sp. NPDC050187 TaxID=3364277 RepID=UPI0037AC3A1A
MSENDGSGPSLPGRRRATGEVHGRAPGSVSGYRRVVGAHRAPGFPGPTRGYLFTVALLAGTASMPILAAISAGSATVGGTSLPNADTPFLPTPSRGPVVIGPPRPASPAVAAPIHSPVGGTPSTVPVGGVPPSAHQRTAPPARPPAPSKPAPTRTPRPTAAPTPTTPAPTESPGPGQEPTPSPDPTPTPSDICAEATGATCLPSPAAPSPSPVPPPSAPGGPVTGP